MVCNRIVNEAAAYISHESSHPPLIAAKGRVELTEISVNIHPDHRTTVHITAFVTEKATNQASAMRSVQRRDRHRIVPVDNVQVLGQVFADTEHEVERIRKFLITYGPVE